MTIAIVKAFRSNGWFTQPGAYVLVDGQFGSTGKGAIAALIGTLFGDSIDVVTTNAGPNSGHTGYTFSHEKILTQQLPVAAIAAQLSGKKAPLAYLNGGAIIDPGQLLKEMRDYNFWNLAVHPCAAVITDSDRRTEAEGTVALIASTGKGVGSALARKILRDQKSIYGNYNESVNFSITNNLLYYVWSSDRVFVETAQGFSLGINSAQFYPHVTSRECTVMQAIADARIPAQMVRKVIMSVRTFPIRVGNTDKGYSGDCYSDQKEIQWSDIGVDPELTTVTKRVRRVFTWSRQQFREALAANRPDVVFLNFCQYLNPSRDPDDKKWTEFVNDCEMDYRSVMGRDPDFWLYGWGPYPEDITETPA